jgi:hypothetical protein
MTEGLWSVLEMLVLAATVLVVSLAILVLTLASKVRKNQQ